MKKFLIIIIIIAFSKGVYSDFIMPISVDLDVYDIQIGYGFSGKEITLFGAKDRLDKILITLVGPERNYIINQRKKISSFWLKREVAIFNNIPSYYATWISQDIKYNNEIVDFYNVDIKNITDKLEAKEIVDKSMKEAFLLDMENNKKLYHSSNLINITNNNLFKIKLSLPDNATIGDYLINVTGFKNNIPDGKVSLTFNMAHSNFNKFLYELNAGYSKIYALLLIIVPILNVICIKYIFKLL